MTDVISVSALNAYVKNLLERDIVLTDVAINGEISNFSHHIKTGHYYFTIKDEKCTVKVVMFRHNTANINFMPKNGDSVIVRGQITLYEAQGSFQINADAMFEHGIGTIQIAFEKLKQKLEAKGYFAPERKKMLPEFPKCVGLVTSKTGAAVQDIYNVTTRRNPSANFLLCSVNVQGSYAENEIAAAIQTLDKSKRCDVIIVARGGGSIEDLYVFNSEIIANAAYKCKTPIVSAIGHETDFCILDFVADLRAPTPSAAAEIVMPNMQNELENANLIFDSIKNLMINRLLECQEKTKLYANNYVLKQVAKYPATQMAHIYSIKFNIMQNMHSKIKQAKKSVLHYATLGDSLNPMGVLARGYSIVKKDNYIVKTAQSVSVGDDINVKLHSGEIECKVTNIKGDE